MRESSEGLLLGRILEEAVFSFAFVIFSLVPFSPSYLYLVPTYSKIQVLYSGGRRG